MSIRRILRFGALALAGLPGLAPASDPLSDPGGCAATVGAQSGARQPPGSAEQAGLPQLPDLQASSGSGAPPTPVQPEREHSVPVLGVAASAAGLGRARGGTGGMAGSATLGGLVSGNSATNVVTGANSIQASSFAGASGIPVVIQNTGANVLIQNATVINLQFK